MMGIVVLLFVALIITLGLIGYNHSFRLGGVRAPPRAHGHRCDNSSSGSARNRVSLGDSRTGRCHANGKFIVRLVLVFWMFKFKRVLQEARGEIVKLWILEHKNNSGG